MLLLNRFFKGDSGGFALMELTDNDGKLTFVNDDGKHIYRTKIKQRRGHELIEPLVPVQTTLLRNFFINDKNTDVVSAFWKWFSPVRLR